MAETTVVYNPKSADRAYLEKAGLYGEGQEHDADVQLFSAVVAEPGSMDAPFDDKNCEKDSYTVWTFRVIHDGKVVFARSRAQANTLPNVGSKNIPWMNNLAISPVGTADDGNPMYDLSKASGIKCVIKVAAPNKDKNDPTMFYTGKVVDVFGLKE